MKLKKKPDEIEAVKFEGGAENAQEVAEFIKARAAHLFVTRQMPILNDGETVVEEELHINCRGRLESIVRPGDWVVIEPGDINHVYPTTEFNLFAQYEASDG